MPESLPIDPHLPRIVDALRERGRLVVRAEPGAGKTTRLAPALVDAGLLGTAQRVVVVEPRRAAARMAATRVAEERRAALGREIGYVVRFEARVSAQSRVVYETDGVFLRQILDDPSLPGVGAVVLDEFHERGLTTDLLLAFLCDVQETLRPDLRVVVTSATLEADPLVAYLSGTARATATETETATETGADTGAAPGPEPGTGSPWLIDVTGRSYPIEVLFRRDDDAGPFRAERFAARIREELLGRSGPPEGSVLVFVPGAAEIRAVSAALESWSVRTRRPVMPLHGRLPIERQLAAIRASIPRVIVATNVAEASLTVEGVHEVIDSGRARVARHDPERGLTELMAARISRASATQRAGRAGREAPGRCVRLYSEADFAARAEFADPEVRTAELTDALLALARWGVRDPARFRWLTAPRAASIDHAQETLRALRAIDRAGRLTSSGEALARLPLATRTGRMLQVAQTRGALESAARLAAELEHPGRDDASASRRARVEQTRAHLVRAATGSTTAAHSAPSTSSGPDTRTRHEMETARAFLAGHPDRLGRLRPTPTDRAEAELASGVLARIDASLPVGTQYLVAIELIAQRRGRERVLWSPRAAPVEPEWIDELFGDAISTSVQVRFDAASERVVARRVRSLLRLALQVDEVPVPAEKGSRVLADAARSQLELVFAEEREFRSLLARLRWLAHIEAPPGTNAAMSDPPTREPLDDWVDEALLAHCASKRSFSELRRAPFTPVLRALLPREVRGRLDQWVPDQVLLPSGRQARVDYESGPQPLVAARLQEFFGTGRPPQLGSGRVPLLLHLLAPNGRPVQVTQDLESFWTGVYPKIRTELRRRYPRHSWPDDPHTAVAEARPGKPRGRR